MGKLVGKPAEVQLRGKGVVWVEDKGHSGPRSLDIIVRRKMGTKEYLPPKISK